MSRIILILSFMLSLFAVPAFAETIRVDGATSAYAKKKVSKRSYKKRRATKRRTAKRRVKKRRYAGVVAQINLSTQRMNVYQNGRRVYTWKISSGRSGYRTPTGSYRVGRMHKEYYSRKYDNAPMPYAMFFRGGYAIHGTNAVSRLGRPASHGCIRLHTANAAKLFSMVRRQGGRVKITY